MSWKSRGLLVVIAVFTAAVFVAAAVVEEWRAHASGRPTSANLAKVMAGMSEVEVMTLLGPPSETSRTAGGVVMLGWREEVSLFGAQRMPTAFARVMFRDGRACGAPFSL
jgi:hypothetical protein